MDSVVAIITGAARGIGFALADELLQLAYWVVLVDNNETRGKEAELTLQAKHGSGKVIFEKCDVSVKEQLNAAFERAKSVFGRIDLVINNAGIVDEPNPERMVAVNLMGAVYGCDLALKYMGKKNGGNGGLVINVSSIVGLLPYPDTPVYVSTKHAMIGLTRSYGHDIHFDRNGVVFTALCPHYTDTEILKEAKRLEVYNPDPAKVETMSAEKVAKSIKKILNDKLNGSVLLVLSDREEYDEIPAHLMKIPTALA